MPLFLHKGLLPENTDINTISDIGVYDLSGKYLNMPFSGSTWGQLVVLGKINKSQFVTKLTSDEFHGYMRENISITEWTKVF